VSDYYLAVPSIGWAWVAATALAAASRQAFWMKLAAVSVLGLHLVYAGAGTASPQTSATGGTDARHLFFALDPAASAIRASSSSSAAWTRSVLDGVFRFENAASRAHLPGSAMTRRPGGLAAGPAYVETALCAPAEIAQAARERRLAAYRWVPRKLHAWTRHYRHRLPREWLGIPPVRIDTADESAARWLGPGWHQIEPGGRWMSLRARQPSPPQYPSPYPPILGYRPAEPDKPPACLTVRLNGAEARRFVLPRGKAAFAVTRAALPAPAAARICGWNWKSTGRSSPPADAPPARHRRLCASNGSRTPQRSFPIKFRHCVRGVRVL
jgi:hypothetical protein